MSDWVRFEQQGKVGFGTLSDEVITAHSGDMFQAPTATAEQLALAEVKLLTPVPPALMIGLWNNFHERARAEGLEIPKDPLYFFKPPSSFLAHGESIRRPAGYAGRIVFEAELGVVIGRTCQAVSEAEAADYVFGYTCVNDVTAGPLIKEDPSFEQWCRAKGYDTFGACGPYIRTGIDPGGMTVKALQNDRERQSYPVSDMVFSPLQLVSRISHFMTLHPGDLIACGTSLGARPMRDGDRIDVQIEGLGTLSNDFRHP